MSPGQGPLGSVYEEVPDRRASKAYEKTRGVVYMYRETLDMREERRVCVYHVCNSGVDQRAPVR